MLVLIISLLALCLVAFIAGKLCERSLKEQLKRGEISEMPTIKKTRPDGCCGKHAVCEKEALAEAMTQPAEYFEDEELDAFKGREADDYAEAEVEQFDEVLTTLRPTEVAAWLRSLQVRGIALPNELKDEAFLLMEEAQQSPA